MSTIKAIKTEDGAFEILKQICQDFGIRNIFLGIFCGENSQKESFLLYSTYLEIWQKYYLKNKCYLFDPIFSNVGKVSFAFEWESHDAPKSTFLQGKMIRRMHKFDVDKGTTIPLLPHPTHHVFNSY